jgi:hypothetical protein
LCVAHRDTGAAHVDRAGLMHQPQPNLCVRGFADISEHDVCPCPKHPFDDRTSLCVCVVEHDVKRCWWCCGDREQPPFGCTVDAHNPAPATTDGDQVRQCAQVTSVLIHPCIGVGQHANVKALTGELFTSCDTLHPHT